jgi:hypothetical protein
MGQRLYPFLPVRWLARYQYNTKQYVKNISCPILVAHNKNDEIIPYDEGREIFAAAAEPKQFLDMLGGHNDGFIVSGEFYVQELKGTSINCLCPLALHPVQNQGTLLKPCPSLIFRGLSKKCNAESEPGVKPRRARSEACICDVVSLDNGITIVLRLTPCSYRLQVTQRTQAINRGALKSFIYKHL